jgi:hypothetical protein
MMITTLLHCGTAGYNVGQKKHCHMKIGICSALLLGIGLALFLTTTPVLAQATTHTTTNANADKKSAARQVGTVPGDISPDAAEVIWLYHHGSTRLELLHYVNASHADFKLSVEDVNYLKDIGISTDVVFAMVRPPEARENVVRLKGNGPRWYSSRLGTPGRGHPQRALENHEAIQTEDVETDVLNAENEAEARRVRVYPHYFGPSSDPNYGFTPTQQREPNVAPAPSDTENRVPTPRDQR